MGSRPINVNSVIGSEHIEGGGGASALETAAAIPAAMGTSIVEFVLWQGFVTAGLLDLIAALLMFPAVGFQLGASVLGDR